MKSVDFVAQKVGDCAPNMKLFPKRIAKAQYNVYGNVMEAMLKPFVNGVYGMMGNIVFVASQIAISHVVTQYEEHVGWGVLGEER